MNTEINQINGLMRNLVKRIGGIDAFCAAYEAYTGQAQSRGTVSRKMNDQCEWWISDMMAVQSALSLTSVSDHIDRMHTPTPRGLTRAVNMIHQIKDMSREMSEAEFSAMAVHYDNSPEAVDNALREIAEAIESLETMAKLIEARK